MSGAAQLDRERLAKLLGMLGSSHDGEVLAASRQAERLRRAAGVTWHEIVGNGPAEPRPPTPTLAEILQAEFALTNWEREFVRSVAQQNRPLSPKQAAVVDRLAEKCRRARGAWQ